MYLTNDQTIYCLQSKIDDKLYRMHTKIEDGQARFALSTSLPEDHRYPVFYADSPDALTQLLASPNHHDSIDPFLPQVSQELVRVARIVRIDTTNDITALYPDETIALTKVLSAKKFSSIIARYANEPVTSDITLFALFEMPVGESLDSLQRFKGCTVNTEFSDKIKLHHLFEVPEDYLPDLKGKSGFAAAITEVY